MMTFSSQQRMDVDRRLKRLELDMDFAMRYLRCVAQAMGLRKQVDELEEERAAKLSELDNGDSFQDEEPTR
jgi:hypothetical protein